jgi:hypothetical protein
LVQNGHDSDRSLAGPWQGILVTRA